MSENLIIYENVKEKLAYYDCDLNCEFKIRKEKRKYHK